MTVLSPLRVLIGASAWYCVIWHSKLAACKTLPATAGASGLLAR
jgi:hypothetical protein